MATSKSGNLTGEAFVKALQSDTVTLIVGPAAEPILVSKDIICLRSEYFAKHLAKPDVTEIELPTIGVAVSKMFVCWCYQERLQPFHNPRPTAQTRKDEKELLIDLWLFADLYSVPKLQNHAITALTSLLATSPALLEKEDIEYIWTSSAPNSSHPLKDLAILTLVAQIETTNASMDDLPIHLEDFTQKLYKALKLWMGFEVSAAKAKAGKKWAVLVQSEEVVKGLMVREGRMHDVRAIRREAARRPFGVGEVIEID